MPLFASTTWSSLATKVPRSVVKARPPIPTGPSSSRWASSFVHLGDLANNKGATKANTRLGRGSSSTKGGTSGRGHKGQKARAGNGKPNAGFEGGQTPITRLFPKRGFVNFASKEYAPLSIAKVQQHIAEGRIDPAEPLDLRTVFMSNLVRGIKGWSGVKLLGDLQQMDPSLPLPPLDLRLSRYSKSAAKAVKEAGGKVVAVYHNALALRQAAYPEKFEGREVQEARPIRRVDIEYYSNPRNHGYLASSTQQQSSAGIVQDTAQTST